MKWVELYWPHPLLKQGLVMIDTPGLNENESLTAVVLEHLDQVPIAEVPSQYRPSVPFSRWLGRSYAMLRNITALSEHALA